MKIETSKYECYYKKGDKHDPENSHPISLISIIWKIMESLKKKTFLDFPREKMFYKWAIRLLTWEINNFTVAKCVWKNDSGFR